MGMTSHFVYTAWDAERPASLSPGVIGDIIRGRIGFDGFLMSDDLGMHALTGGFDERAQGVVAAGCDAALHCSGDMAEMVAVAKGLGEMTDAALKRLDRAMASVADAAQAASYDELRSEEHTSELQSLLRISYAVFCL